MKGIFKKILKGTAIGAAAVFLVAVGIDATDNYDNLSQSILGRLIAPQEEPCPKDMVYVPNEKNGFCIDKFEVAPSDKCQYLSISSQSQTRDNLADGDCRPVSESGREPWRFLSQSQATLACAKAGKRLPTAEEWYQASLGTPDKQAERTSDDCHLSSNWPEQPGKTGSAPQCQSSFGAYDMVGNVWEWVKGEALDGEFRGREMPESGYITAVDTNGLPVSTQAEKGDPNFNYDRFWYNKKGVRSLARGGYWGSREDGGMYAAYLNVPPSFAGAGIGFRCVRNASPQ